MGKYYCDYCDTYLTHDSPSVRKTHCSGRKHKENVKLYYQKWMEDQAQSLIDATTAAYKAGKMNKGVAIPPPGVIAGPMGPQPMPPQGPPHMGPPGMPPQGPPHMGPPGMPHLGPRPMMGGPPMMGPQGGMPPSMMAGMRPPMGPMVPMMMGPGGMRPPMMAGPQ